MRQNQHGQLLGRLLILGHYITNETTGGAGPTLGHYSVIVNSSLSRRRAEARVCSARLRLAV